MSSDIVLVTNPRNYPLMATTDGLLVGGGQTVEVEASLLLPDIDHTGLTYVDKPQDKAKKTANKPESEPDEAEGAEEN